MFPMPTVPASNHLRSRGYDCRPEMLDVLVKNGVVKLAEPETWTLADVDPAAEYYEACSFFVPFAMMCVSLGCDYAHFKRPLRTDVAFRLSVVAEFVRQRSIEDLP
ncbi:hypothetical protein BH11PLA2_BH11PLA2_40750 [soil metagenome]